MTIKILIMISAIVLGLLSQSSYADSSYDEKISFADSLEKTLGHFWAIEQNLNDQNADLALVHATHPIAELYDSMKPDLKKVNPDFDAKVQKILMELGQKTSSDITIQDAQKAIDQAKEIIQEARILVVGQELSDDKAFKAKLIDDLLRTSISEYQEGVKNGQIEKMSEFQDGSAFVWRSQQIFNDIKPDLSENEVKMIEGFYSDLWNAYDKKSDPEQIATFANGIISEIDVLEKRKETDLLTYVENIRDLLNQVKVKYTEGDKDKAMSLATKAYLDNFEYLESPLKESGQKDLVNDMETMMRIELRDMIKNEAPVLQVEQKVDDILAKMNTVEKIVPEFGPLVIGSLVVSIIGIIVITKKTSLKLMP